jgi:hypothetical protein
MPKYDNTVQFSLPSEKLDKLRSLARDGESIGLCAKRLLLGVIDGGNEGEIDRPSLDQVIGRIESIENCLDRSFYPTEERIPDRVTAIEEKLNQIEERLAGIECLAEPIDEPPATSGPINPPWVEIGFQENQIDPLQSKNLSFEELHEKGWDEAHKKACERWDSLVNPESRNEPPATPGPIAPDIFVVCHLSPDRSILGYWGGKAEWVTDRSHALTFDTESKAKAQLTRSRKKYPDRDIRYNSIATLQKLDGR